MKSASSADFGWLRHIPSVNAVAEAYVSVVWLRGSFVLLESGELKYARILCNGDFPLYVAG